MAKKNDLKNFRQDFDLWFDESFNKAIKGIFNVLGTEEVSPVYTGYFASSWRVTAGATAQIASRRLQKETREESDKNRRTKEPWASVYNERFGSNRDAWVPNKKGKILPRFPDIPYIDYLETPVVNIANVTAYAAYALENPSVATYVQGQLKNDIDRAFKTTPDKVRLRLATTPQGGRQQLTDLFDR